MQMTDIEIQPAGGTTDRLRKPARQNAILSLLRANPSLRVNQLTEKLNVSAETIRRDLIELDHAGRLSRTYGGAVSSQRFEPHLAERQALYVDERLRIARAALSEIGDADAILIGGGATVTHFARALVDFAQPLTVITMSLNIMPELGSNPHLQVVALPGIYDHREGIVAGADTIRAIERFRAPIAVLGASGVDASGVTEAMLTASQVYSALVDHSDRQFILADHSKFNRHALMQVCKWQTGMTVFTDAPPPSDIHTAIERNGAAIRICP